MCLANALHDTTANVFGMWDEIGADIDIYLESLDINKSNNRVLAHMLGRCNSIAFELLYNFFNADKFTLSTWSTTVRCFLETTADFQYAFNSAKSADYVHNYLHILHDSTYDIKDFAEAKSYANLHKVWRQQQWSGATYEDKIKSVFGDEYLAIYGYCSRLTHGVNRDSYFREFANAILVRLFLFYKVLLAFCEVIISNEAIKNNNLSSRAELLKELIISGWETRGERINNILLLMTFFDAGWPPLALKEVKSYRQKIKSAYANNGLPSYEFVDHKNPEEHMKESRHERN